MTAARVRPVMRIVLIALACLVLASFASLQIRYGAAVLGLLPTPQANAYESEYLVSAPIGESVTVRAEYCSEIIAGNDPANPSGHTSTDLTFNDSWFSTDARIYNHDIATASAVLSAVCNSESKFYGSANGSIPYVEHALGSLGFDNVRTESYALRSNALDQMAALFVDSHDVSAYAFASKTIPGTDGAPDETLVFVGIRGTYGIEWLSNVNMFGSASDHSDHLGFKTAEAEVEQALETYLSDIGADGARTKLLITGHSRGGSIANLLAADLNVRSDAGTGVVPSQNVFAYTFASPGSTQSKSQSSGLHKNIFNIVNPADIVPQLPLSTWGYGRYGTTMELPTVSDGDFAVQHAAMQVKYLDNTGFANTYEDERLHALDSFDVKAGESLPSLDKLISPEGLISAVQTVAGIDVATVCASHYPDTYIAWMQSVDPNRMTVL